MALTNRQRAFIEHYLIVLFASGSSVVGLLKRCSPTAIARLVISVVVDAINRVLASWLGSHIAKKISEAANPAIANLYAAPTIKMVFAVIRVVTSVFCAQPTAVFRGVRFSVSAKKVSGQFFVKATA